MYTISVVFTNRFAGNGNYGNGSTYDYLLEDSVKADTGDYVVVHNGSELAIAKVVRVTLDATEKASKTVVSVITAADMEDYKTRNAAISEEARARKQAFSKLEQLLAAESKMDRYRLLAARNADAKALLEAAGIKLD